jgi:FAD:protein FMN transferase
VNGPYTHLEPVMGTVVGITSPEPLPPAGIKAAVAVLHDADRVFSTWNPASPLSRLRAAGAAIHDLELDDALQIYEVLERCALAKQMTRGAFDPWALPGGLDPTGLVKGWAARRALAALLQGGAGMAMINAGGDIAVSGGSWRIGIRHPDDAEALVGVVQVSGAIATSGDYERPGQLVDPLSGRTVKGGAATVTGPELDLADAIATGLSVAGPELLPVVESLPGYDAYLITADGRHYATSELPLVAA